MAVDPVYSQGVEMDFEIDAADLRKVANEIRQLRDVYVANPTPEALDACAAAARKAMQRLRVD